MSFLIPISGSPHSQVTLRFGAHLAPCFETPPTLLVVISHPAHRSEADRLLAQADMPPTWQLYTRVRVGHAAEEIVREASDGHHALVVVGNHQPHNRGPRFRANSTSLWVAEHAPCPVIVVKELVRPIQRVLLCDSGATNPSVVGRFAARLPNLLRDVSAVVVLHVMSQISAGPGVRGTQLRAGAGELIREHTPEGALLSRDIKALRSLGVDAEPQVRHGFVVDEILAEAEGGDYDLVVIGAYRGEGWQRILLNDLARKIITRISRPILIMR